MSETVGRFSCPKCGKAFVFAVGRPPAPGYKCPYCGECLDGVIRRAWFGTRLMVDVNISCEAEGVFLVYGGERIFGLPWEEIDRIRRDVEVKP